MLIMRALYESFGAYVASAFSRVGPPPNGADSRHKAKESAIVKGRLEGHFRRSARVPNWSGVAQQPDAHSVLRHFGIAPEH